MDDLTTKEDILSAQPISELGTFSYSKNWLTAKRM